MGRRSPRPHRRPVHQFEANVFGHQRAPVDRERSQAGERQRTPRTAAALHRLGRHPGQFQRRGPGSSLGRARRSPAPVALGRRPRLGTGIGQQQPLHRSAGHPLDLGGPAPPGFPGRQHPRTERRRRALPGLHAGRHCPAQPRHGDRAGPISGRILRSLYGACGVDVRIGGFEAATLADGTYDLILSNVPFGRYGVLDNRNRPYSRASIHNWFVGRALDVLRPGGLVCFITSTYFLDESDAGMRAHVASEADLVTAFRLPRARSSASHRPACRLTWSMLQKARAGRRAAQPSGSTWTTSPSRCSDPAATSSTCGSTVGSCAIRSMCWVASTGSARGFQAVPTAMLDGDLESALLGAQALVPRARTACAAGGPRQNARDIVPAPAGTRPGSLVVSEGRIGIVEGDHVVDLHDRLNATVRQRIAGMVDIRDRARALPAHSWTPRRIRR